ncbi:major facilitator superfamily domain-containing protein [Lentinula raphanica]|nr:major facilitator superfamily domain-containing protein [Lentinula raphanica]
MLTWYVSSFPCSVLGAAEAGYYPGVIYYLAFWFRPEDLALRVAVFYSFGQVSGFVGGFLAFAVSFANGILPGWRWLFIIEGIPAILMGLATFFILPTFWTFSATWFCHAVGGFGLSYVLPTVIFELVELINIICYTLLLTVNSTAIRYLALLISTATAGSVYPILWPNRVKAAHGTTAAAIAIGVTNALAQFSGILGSQVFLSVYGPTYRVSFIVCIGLLAGAVVFITLSGALLGELFSNGEADTGVSSSLPDDP